MDDYARLRWHCRRGMKELDDLLLRYLEREYSRATEQEQRSFTALLELQDPQLWAYMTGREQPAESAIADVIRKICAAT